ncbi:uncharacterized protein PWA37_000814 [Arxiozyma heterogenica]|uniref:non-specific serine/threonine protein kinase n=1 Tax=Arxiozyma heterogenica TaxID=278026 RepID=A0AAN8A8L2_9SACH|nr:hypothetical protein RI543_002335 [Kazachstania heterogenica]
MYSFSKSLLHGIKHVPSGKSPAANNNSNEPSTNSTSHHLGSSSPSSSFPLNPYTIASNELKRFLKPSIINKSKDRSSPFASSSTNNITTNATLTLSAPLEQTKQKSKKITTKTNTVLELEDIKNRYGEIGKLLGSGANGSVHIITRQSDQVKFAIKQFSPKHSTETQAQYFKRCNQEYLIGSSLTHTNIVHILDFIMVPKDESPTSSQHLNSHSNSHSHSSSNASSYLYYEIMEFLPIDLFDVVMSNEMSRYEINCCFKQLLEAVDFLHQQGVAHRDLKLDNCCMTKDGILKLLDFGSAFVFHYPFEPKKRMATGVMGSDPYLPPELYCNDGNSHSFSSDEYDPSKVDVWSLAIIYCCMILKRFPWKKPCANDPSFKNFLMPDNEPHDYVASARTHEELVQKRKQLRNVGQDPSQIKFPDHLRQKVHPKDLHGPYSLFRLLPHGCRPIISCMMAIDPKERPTMKEIMADPWVQSIDNCTIDSQTHKTVRAKGHHHTVVMGDIPSYKV